MSMSTWFGFGGRSSGDDELPDLFPIPVAQADFVSIDIMAIYSKILTDALERTHGLSDDQVALMWDNCLKSEKNDGLITMLSKAMADKKELFLVYEKAVKVIREATGSEQTTIREDYKKQGSSSVGIYISFQNFRRSDMVKFYLALSYCGVGSLWKSMNLSKAVQLKLTDLRKSVAAIDSADVKAQAKRMAEALGKGRDIMMDAEDEIVTATPDLTATKETATFVTQKLSFYLGMSESYLTGIQTGGLGTTGENDMRADERGLKAYFVSILKPVVEALFGIKASYKTQDFRQISSSMEVLKTFALIDETLVSAENKRRIVNGILGLPEDAKGDAPPAPAPRPAPTAVPPVATA